MPRRHVVVWANLELALGKTFGRQKRKQNDKAKTSQKTNLHTEFEALQYDTVYGRQEGCISLEIPPDSVQTMEVGQTAKFTENKIQSSPILCCCNLSAT